jgi:DNA (cytosine-5)-methyltransferase 1
VNYYNEHDPNAAAWLRELIRAGEIPPGDVDERSIREVWPTDLRGYVQCHFFAGIGGWSLALRLAGWPDDQPVWTGSCPCQPFSAAGKIRGIMDARHLWPVWLRLIAECGGLYGVPTVFGEQVASADGRVWLAGVRASLETLGRKFGAADLCAAGVGAPHIRQRLWWVANAGGGECHSRRGEHRGQASEGFENRADADRCGCKLHSGLANSTSVPGAQQQHEPGKGSRRGAGAHDAAECGGPGGLGDTIKPGLEGHAGNVDHGSESGRLDQESDRSIAPAGRPWDAFDLLPCLDGKARRVEPGTFPLAHGVSGRVGLLRGYGNAIVPQVAAEFIQAAIESFR